MLHFPTTDEELPLMLNLLIFARLEEAEHYWFAFVLYSVKRLSETNADDSSQGTGGDGFTLCQILRVEKLKYAGPILSNRYGTDWEKRLELLALVELSSRFEMVMIECAKELQANFVHLSLLSNGGIDYGDTFLLHRLSPFTVDEERTSSLCLRLPSIWWFLFLAIRTYAFSRFKDLVTCTNGLVAILAILIIHVLVRVRNFNLHDSPRFVMKGCKCVVLLASLCNICETSEDELRKTMEKDNDLIEDILKKNRCSASECRSENLENIDTGLLEDTSLSSSLNILENDYADATRNKGELDERVFVKEEDSLLGSGSLSGGAMNISGAKRKIDSIASPARTIISPVAPYCSPSASHAKAIPCGSNSKVKATPVATAMTTAKWLRTIISPRPPKPLPELERFLSSCDSDVTTDVIRRANIILQAIFPSSGLGEQCITGGLQCTSLMDRVWAEQRRLEALKVIL
ncbi:unnamed protein product [Camellia sinensis]